MSKMTIDDAIGYGMYTGAGLVVVPATTTFFIAFSKVIVINLIANNIFKILTAGQYGLDVYGIGLVEVPLLWKISLISAAVGGTILAITITAALVNKHYRDAQAERLDS